MYTVVLHIPKFKKKMYMFIYQQMALCTQGRLKERKLLSPILEAEGEASKLSSPRAMEQHNDLLGRSSFCWSSSVLDLYGVISEEKKNTEGKLRMFCVRVTHQFDNSCG